MKTRTVPSRFEQQLQEMLNVGRQSEIEKEVRRCRELKASILMERKVLEVLYGFSKEVLDRDDTSTDVRLDLKQSDLSVIKTHLEKANQKLGKISDVLAKKISFEQENRLRLLTAFKKLATSLGMGLSAKLDQMHSETMGVDYKYQSEDLGAKSIVEWRDRLEEKCQVMQGDFQKLKVRLKSKIPGFDEDVISQVISDNGAVLSDLDLDVLVKFRKSPLKRVLRLKLG